MFDGCSPTMEHLILLHDHILSVLFSVVSLSLYMLSLSKLGCSPTMEESYTLEVLWTGLPMFVLLMIGLPSIKALYYTEMSEEDMVVKVMGNQWYWTYEIGNNSPSSSFMSSNSSFRMLSVDSTISLPTGVCIKMLTSSTDVIHSLSLPSLGVKADAIPGRTNQLNTIINQSGVFVGQCSEICGANHSFMPLVIEAIPLTSFMGCTK